MENISPDILSALMNSGANDPQALQLKRQQMMADQMRQQSMQAPGTQMAGGVALRNTGQVIGNLANGLGAAFMQPKIDQGMQGVQQRSNQARAGYADALGMALRRNPTQPTSPVLPPDGYEDQ